MKAYANAWDLMSIKAKLFAGFGVVILLIVGLATVSLSSNLTIESNYELLANDTVPTVDSLGATLLAGARTVEATSELVQMLLERHHDTVEAAAEEGADTDDDVGVLLAGLPAGNFEEMKVEILGQHDDLRRAIGQFERIEREFQGRTMVVLGAGTAEARTVPERDRTGQVSRLGTAILLASDRVLALIDARASLHEILAAQHEMVEKDSAFFALQSAIDAEMAELAQRRASTQRMIKSSFIYIMGFAALSLLASLVVALVIAGRISRPLARLRNAALQVGNGDFKAAEALQDIRARDEIGDLAAGFRRMAVSLSTAKEKEIRQERLSALGQVAGSVCHELRNPLSTIRTSMSTVRAGTADKGLSIDRALDRIDRSVHRCDTIVGDIMEFSRVQELNPEATRIDSWLAEMLEEHELPPTVVLRRELSSGAAVMLDRTRFRQVLVNLIDNAAQAMTDPQWEPGDRERTIVVRAETAGPHVRLAVTDNGPGISEDKLARIFEPLFTTKVKGVGLGLPTVRKLVEQHDGTIDVESLENIGTTFTVRLPRHVVQGSRESTQIATAA